MSAKQAINDKLQGSVATYLKCGGLLISELRKVYCWVCEWNFFKSVNIWQSYKKQSDSLMHFARLTNTLLNDEESAWDYHFVSCNFAKYSPI